MRIYLKYVLIFLSVLGYINAFAQKQDSLYKTKYFVAPIAYFLPETSWGFGAIGSSSFNIKNNDLRSSVQFVGVYTLKKQLILFAPFRLYPKNKIYSIEGEVGYYDYIYAYYGLGNNTITDVVENYETSFTRVESRFYIKKKKLELGLGFKSDYYLSLNSIEDGLVQNSVFNNKKNFVNGIGLFARIDTRDHKYLPLKGFYLEGSVLTYNKYILSKNTFMNSEIDIRLFSSYKKITIALNTILSLNGSDVHFNKMAMLGGGKRLRGIIQGRFRSNNAFLFQMEGRFPIWKKFSGVLFMGEGVVGKKVVDLTKNKYHWTAGLGLRFLFDKITGLNLRLDYAVSNDDSGLYITIGEAF